MNELMATVKILTFKLCRIRDHIERRLEIAEGDTAAELQYVLSMIAEYEQVPCGWQSDRPLVAEEDKDEKK